MCNVYCLCSSQTEFCWIGLFAFGLVFLPLIKKIICIILVANDLLELSICKCTNQVSTIQDFPQKLELSISGFSSANVQVDAMVI